MHARIRTVFFLLALLLPAFVPQVAAAQKPNIVFLLADDMNRDTWGIYGSKDCKTPHIDRLAREGVRFDRAYCAVAMCAPFRQELYSGRTPWRTGTLPNHSKSKQGTKSIVHYLKPLGYRVALIGKSHVGPKACYPFEHINHGDKTKDHNPFYLKKAGEIMDACKKEKKPFCIFIASNDGHGPYTTGDPSAYKAEDLTIPPYWLDTPELRRALPKYYAEITNFDKLAGDMRAALEKRGLWENTLFVVCSEQGTGFPFAKWTCYDNGLHTGMVAHWGGLTRAGHVAEDLVSMADVTPTLVEAAGGTLEPGDCDGKSFLKMLKGESLELHKYVYGAFTNCNIIGSRDRIYPIRVIRSRSHTLIYNPNHSKQTSNTTLDTALAMLTDPKATGTGIAPSWVRLAQKDPSAKPIVHKLHHRPEYELYHLDSDPYELTNCIGQEEHKATADELKTRLHAWLAANNDRDPIATEKSLVKSGTKKKKRRAK